MSSYLELYNSDGNQRNRSEMRGIVHRDGRLHGAAHVWVYRKTAFDTELLLQKRSKEKDTFPGHYDVSCGGHVEAYENFMRTAIREMQEELGLQVTPDALQLVCKRHVQWTKTFDGNTVINNEIVRTYLYRLPDADTQLVYAKDEIESLAWVSTSVILEARRKNNPLCCFSEVELQAVLSRLDPQSEDFVPSDILRPPNRETLRTEYIIHISDPYSRPDEGGYAGSDEWTHHETHYFYGTLPEARVEGERLVNAFYDDPHDRYLYSVVSWITEPGSEEPL